MAAVPEQLLLAFDTATEQASVALVRGNDCLGERSTRAVSLLADVDELLRACACARDDLQAIAVGVGPGRYTSLRMGIVTARVLAFTLGVRVAGVSTLAALAAGAAAEPALAAASGAAATSGGPAVLPVIDARRGEVFSLDAGGEPVCLAPAAVEAAGRLCVGDGAVRYREILEAAGAEVPDDADLRHRVSAARIAELARDFGPADTVEPLYLRLPDAERTRREFPSVEAAGA